MTDNLQNLLKALTDTGSFKDGAMLLGPSKSPMAMMKILHAIDTTILPRVVTFAVGDMSVTLNVGGRRLRACLSASKALGLPKAVLKEPLSSDDPKTVQKIGDVLQKLLAADGELTLRRVAELTSADKADGGVGLDILAELWGVDPDAEPPTPLEQFVTSIGEDILASLVISGDAVTDPTGDTALTMMMEKAIIPSLVPRMAKLSSSPDLLVLNGMLADDALIALVTFEDAKLIVATPPTAYAKIAASWSQF